MKKEKLSSAEKAVIDKLLPRLYWEIGFTGCGPTSLNKYVPFPILTSEEQKIWDHIWPGVREAQLADASIKWEHWREVVQEETGEDDLPEWDPKWLSPETIAEKEHEYLSAHTTVHGPIFEK